MRVCEHCRADAETTVPICLCRNCARVFYGDLLRAAHNQPDSTMRDVLLEDAIATVKRKREIMGLAAFINKARAKRRRIWGCSYAIRFDGDAA